MIKFNHYSETHVGHVRKANEDNHADRACANGAHAFVVCDGMGGHVGGATASAMAMNCILDFLEKADLTDCNAAIRDACNYANTQVYATSINDPSLHGMGTTCVVMVVKDDYCYFGHVGDSRLYLYTNKELHRLTRDQSFVQMLVDRGEISDDMAESHPKKNQILQAIGIGPEIQPKTCERRVSPKKGDRFLLCTDGLNGMINDTFIASAFRNNEQLSPCGKKLIQLALDHGGRDNVTVSMIEITESAHLSSDFKSENPELPAPRTEMFAMPEKTSSLKSIYKKYKIHLIASCAAMCVVAVALSLVNGTEDSSVIAVQSTNPDKSTDSQMSKEPTGSTPTGEITVDDLRKKTKAELQKWVNKPISDCKDKDTTVVSIENDKIKLKIKGGIFAGIEEQMMEKPEETSKKNKENNTAVKKNKGDFLREYKVQKGEKLDDIAKKMRAQFRDCTGITAEKIANNNGINNPDKVDEGIILKIYCHID
jgi:serine/threonine protein phosphatase PrpC